MGLVPKTDEDWVHLVKNFAWDHQLVNIYETLIVDMLHQLLKGMVMHLLSWVKLVLAIEVPAARKQKSVKPSYLDFSDADKLDVHFHRVTDFTGLKHFKKFSAIKQWTGIEQKALVQQIIPVLAPLLPSSCAHVLDFCRALVDFVLIAQYHSHDKTTLEYLSQALMKINVYKKAI